MLQWQWRLNAWGQSSARCRPRLGVLVVAASSAATRDLWDEFQALARSKCPGSDPNGRKYVVSETPTIETRIDQPYVAIPVSVRMEKLGTVVPPLMDRVYEWLEAHHIAPAGPPFWRYVVVDMDAELELETGVPVATPIDGNGEVLHSVLPGGRYATVTHTGHPDTLVTATGDLLQWAADRGLEWDADGNRWGCRLEEYLSDPADAPDMSQWETRLAFRLRD
jgi:effector-binding domain-containing protein